MSALPLVVFAMVLVLFVLLRGRKARTNADVEDMARKAVEAKLKADSDHNPAPDADKSDPTE
ncbi:MAG: hypothetical protein P8J78_12105 [Maricaulis sp.]|jgi:hypothetical protein|nr:hypothetical protein [Maricaulis sp.]MDG2045343.1 hypothetical protein [Maricaulis sp.]